jgi:hypothetical protein
LTGLPPVIKLEENATEEPAEHRCRYNNIENFADEEVSYLNSLSNNAGISATLGIIWVC